MEIETKNIKWDAWYIQIIGAWLLWWVVRNFNVPIQVLFKVLTNILLVAIIGWWVYIGIDKVNNKMLRKYD